MIVFFALNVFLEGPERVLEAWGGAKAAPRGANKYLSADFWNPNGGPGNLLSKTGVLARGHEIPKSIWRYYTRETMNSIKNEARLMEIVEILESLWRLYSSENCDF